MGMSGCDAAEQHRRIGAERWCVTRKDLRYLQRQVWKAIQTGEIVPTELDDFDPSNRDLGPTIYTLNEQYIKPVTARAGGMSWALMRHPKGLLCDLFVTHGWSEGIFEFLHKVLTSWPSGARHAWCCMLANPQNLDISELLRTPAGSPFAKALAAAPCVLVVPNRHESIYTRLWCVYEAFLAYQWDKVILTASSPACSKVKRVLPLPISCSVAGFFLSYVWQGSVSMTMCAAAALGSYILTIGALLSTHGGLRRFCNCFGAFWMSWCSGSAISSTYATVGIEKWVRTQTQFALTTAGFFIMAEVDGARYEMSLVDQQELTHGYAGSVLHARCSSPADNLRIRAELAGCVEDVDRTVQALMDAGMSTSRLRKAMELGVKMDRFASSAGSASFRWFFIAMTLPDSLPGEVKAPSWLNIVLFLTWLLVIKWSPHDARIFSYIAMQKFAMFFAWPCQLVFALLWLYRLGDTKYFEILLPSCMSGMWVCTLALSVAQIHRVARWPYVGLPLAQMLVSRTRKGLGSALTMMPKAPPWRLQGWASPSSHSHSRTSSSSSESSSETEDDPDEEEQDENEDREGRRPTRDPDD